MATKPVQLEHLRHSLAHLLAAAVLELWPDTKPTIGPAIENGFYYDFQFSKPISETDLPRIEKRMRKLLPTWKAFSRRVVTAKEARAAFKDNPFKSELIDEFARKGETLTFYTSGRFTDLCRGGHVDNLAAIDAAAFKLTKVAGAYWRGDEKNSQLTRIYGVAFATKEELDAHLTMLKKAEARDHRRLGRDLDLYSFHSVAPGAVFWHGNGMVIWNELEKLLREHLLPAGYQEVQTPIMVKPELFDRSGHLTHYKKNMFRVEGRDEELYLKPMNCPEGSVIFGARAWSYRDLPLRQAEIGRIHRNELAGTLGGLFRVRQITQDDGHIYCTPDQLGTELTGVLKLSKKIYAIFGLKPSFYLSTKPDDAMGKPALWTKAEAALKTALKANKLPYKEKPKDGTFYAPKIDIDITDSLGRRWQLCTIQADLVMVPSLPGVAYTDERGAKQKPVVIHRAIFGSFERFIGIIVEHYGGNLPLWLSPVQVGFVPVSDKHARPARKLAQEFRAAGIRASVDTSKETVGYKIRRAMQHKIPYLLVIGDKEAKSVKLAVRVRGSDKLRSVAKKTFIASLQQKIRERKATT